MAAPSPPAPPGTSTTRPPSALRENSNRCSARRLDCSGSRNFEGIRRPGAGHAVRAHDRAHYNDAPAACGSRSPLSWPCSPALVALPPVHGAAVGEGLARERAPGGRGPGRRIVAELPSSDGALGFFAEDHAGFYWPAGEAGKSALRGARLLLDGDVSAAVGPFRGGVPTAETLKPCEGRERWEVALYGTAGHDHTIACGTSARA